MTASTIFFQPYKGRRLNPGQRVAVYRNLNIKTNEVWFSVRDVKTGLVLGHSQSILLSNVTFKVNAAGRERVRREGRKNVHSFAIGNWSGPYYGGDRELFSSNGVAVTYNPYLYKSFVRKDDESPVHAAGLVLLDHKTGCTAHSITTASTSN